MKQSIPAIQKTEGEKIALAKAFLEKRGYLVSQSLVNRQQVAEYLGCSVGAVNNLMEREDFPRPFDICALKKSIDQKRTTPRWRFVEIINWLESRRVA